MSTPEIYCAWCDGEVVTPIQDPEALAWIGDAASTWCSQACADAQTEHEIDAAAWS